MVLEKRLDYGFNGYQVPAMPRATRSIRRSSFRNKAQGNQQCAFDLLATLAGKILLEGESSPATEKDQCDIYENAANKQQKDEENSEKIELHDPRSFKTSFLGSELGSHAHNQHCSMKEFTCTESNAFLGLSSLITSDCPLKVDCGEKLFIGKSKSEEPAKTRPLNIGKAVDSSGVDPRSAGAPSLLNGKSLAFASSDSSAKIPSCTGQLGIRDDEENYSRCSQPSTTTRKTFMKASHIVDRRIRKLLASKYWKLHPASRNGFLSSIDGQLRPVYLNRKVCYKRLRSQRIYPFKKRKLYNCSQASKSDGRTSSESIFSSSGKGIHRYSLGSYAAKLGATETSSIGGRRTSCQFRDSHVKLRIKSFKVPELLIDVPETATVGSLKGTVMEAVTAILGGGLRVGVFLKGKKVRDDGRTLLQTGISRDDKLDALGFTLEPNPKQGPVLLDPEGHPSTPCDLLQPLTRYPPIDGKVHQGVSDLSPDPPVTNLGNFIESDHDSAATPAHMPTDKTTAGSQALISVPATTAEELPIVPMHRKSKRSDIVQRRIRRPFSVTEVEALVQSVENLGTGRWRDVKLRAFDNAKHRTYVDLKDKWKTLVHTARISPQQRRGEPVPQELLDRVLTAHSYWSQQQKNC